MSLPLEAARVTLTVPDRELLPGRVDVAGEGLVEIAVLEAPCTPIPTLEQHPLFIEWVSRVGVCRRPGRVTFLDGVPVGDSFGVFDVVRFVPTADMQLLQRREYVRTEFLVGVRLRPTRPAAPVTRASTLNVSGGGLLVRGPIELDIGDELEFDLEPIEDSGRNIRGRCRVVHRTTDGHLGVHFTRIAEADRDRIVRFAYERELVERGRRLAA